MPCFRRNNKGGGPAILAPTMLRSVRVGNIVPSPTILRKVAAQAAIQDAVHIRIVLTMSIASPVKSASSMLAAKETTALSGVVNRVLQRRAVSAQNFGGALNVRTVLQAVVHHFLDVASTRNAKKVSTVKAVICAMSFKPVCQRRNGPAGHASHVPLQEVAFVSLRDCASLPTMALTAPVLRRKDATPMCNVNPMSIAWTVRNAVLIATACRQHNEPIGRVGPVLQAAVATANGGFFARWQTMVSVTARSTKDASSTRIAKRASSVGVGKLAKRRMSKRPATVEQGPVRMAFAILSPHATPIAPSMGRVLGPRHATAIRSAATASSVSCGRLAPSGLQTSVAHNPFTVRVCVFQSSIASMAFTLLWVVSVQHGLRTMVPQGGNSPSQKS